MQRGGKNLLQIRFPDATQYYPDDEIEIISQGKQHPLDLLEDGRIGRAVDLRRLITHVKLSGRLANLLYSMEVTNTDFYAYQFKPVLKMLNSVGNGILIADEVGLGKTIEAGLIWIELKSRFDYRRLMVLCPAFLREKWQRELKKRFGVDAQILDAKGVHQKLKSSTAEGPLAGFAIIGSMQGLRPHSGWDEEDARGKRASSTLAKYLNDQQHGNPLIDLLIVDEAHYLRMPDLKRRALLALHPIQDL
jgi:SNF2 family DNA or RNA helicase